MSGEAAHVDEQEPLAVVELHPDLVLLATSENDLTELSLNRLTVDAARLPVRVEPMWRIIDATGRMRSLGTGRPAQPRASWPSVCSRRRNGRVLMSEASRPGYTMTA